MTINSTLIISTERWIEIVAFLDGKKYIFSVKTVNGLIKGTHNDGLSTTDGKYFALPDNVRKEHFETIKSTIEKQYSHDKI